MNPINQPTHASDSLLKRSTPGEWKNSIDNGHSIDVFIYIDVPIDTASFSRSLSTANMFTWSLVNAKTEQKSINRSITVIQSANRLIMANQSTPFFCCEVYPPANVPTTSSFNQPRSIFRCYCTPVIRTSPCGSISLIDNNQFEPTNVIEDRGEWPAVVALPAFNRNTWPASSDTVMDKKNKKSLLNYLEKSKNKGRTLRENVMRWVRYKYVQLLSASVYSIHYGSGGMRRDYYRSEQCRSRMRRSSQKHEQQQQWKDTTSCLQYYILLLRLFQINLTLSWLHLFCSLWNPCKRQTITFPMLCLDQCKWWIHQWTITNSWHHRRFKSCLGRKRSSK